MQFNINLKRKNLLEEYIERLGRIPMKTRIMLVFSLLIITCVFFSFRMFFKGESLPPSAIVKKVDFQKELQRLRVERNEVSKILTILRHMENERIVWSEKLWALSNTIPDELWLNAMETRMINIKEKGRVPKKLEVLVLKGIALSQGRPGTPEPVNEFIRNLKETQTFNNDYNTPQLFFVSDTRGAKGKVKDLEFHLVRKFAKK